MVTGYRPFGLFRLLLAYMVAFQHFAWVAPPGLHDLLSRLLTGNIAVMTFFALSGFIIVEAALRFYDGKPVAFAVNRALRIGPPFLVAVALCVAVFALLAWSGHPKVLVGRELVAGAPGMFSARNILANVLAIVPVAGDFIGKPQFVFIPYVWALRAEAWFYAVVLAGLFLGKAIGTKPALLGLLALALLGYAGWKVGLGHRTDIFKFAPYFGFGALAYAAVSSRSRWAAGGSALLLAACLVDYQSYDAASIAQLAAEGLPPLRLVQTILLAACLGAIVVLANASTRFAKADSAAGTLSYPMYLNHGVVLYALLALAEPSLLVFIAGLVAALAVSLAAEMVTEPASKPLRDRVRGRKIQPAPATLAGVGLDV